MKTKNASDDRCPNCGYCPTCGRSNQPRGYYYPYYPWVQPGYPYYYPTVTVGSGTTTTNPTTTFS